MPIGRVYFHIGVGSDVVCSTLIGNARASVGGIGNKTIPRLEPKCKTYNPDNQIYNNGNFMN